MVTFRNFKKKLSFPIYDFRRCIPVNKGSSWNGSQDKFIIAMQKKIFQTANQPNFQQTANCTLNIFDTN